MQQAPARLVWHHDDREPLPCVACSAPMQTLALFAIPIDRCVPHGSWFDRDKLPAVLLESQRVRSIVPAASATAAAVVTTAAATEAAASHHSQSMSTSGALDIAGGAVEIAGTGLLEGAVEMVGAVLDGLFDLC